MVELDYFPRDYEEARSRFISNANQVRASADGSDLSSFPVPSARDPGLSVEFFHLPPSTKKDLLVVLVSGVHGMEAYTGSAIQNMFAAEFLQPRAHSAFETTGVAMVHAMNPFGFKHHRRATENNVNLNRNFGVSPALFQHRNEAYRGLERVLNPKRPAAAPVRSFLSLSFRLLSQILLGRMKASDFIQAVGQGQYEFPEGLEYGGRDFEPQVVRLREFLKETARGYKDVLVLDLHTGLGDRYQLHLMPGSREGSVDKKLFSRLFAPDEDARIYAYTPGDTEGFYTTHGDLNNMIQDLLEPGQTTAALTVEFGTLGNGALPKLKTLGRLVLENQGAHYGYASKSAEEKIRTDFEELFHPSEVRWRVNAVSRARELLSRILSRAVARRHA